MSINLPTYEESELACDDLTATPLQRFVYNYEPGDADNEWRRDLTLALDTVRADLARKILKTTDEVFDLLSSEYVKREDILTALRELFRVEGVEVE